MFFDLSTLLNRVHKNCDVLHFEVWGSQAFSYLTIEWITRTIHDFRFGIPLNCSIIKTIMESWLVVKITNRHDKNNNGLILVICFGRWYLHPGGHKCISRLLSCLKFENLNNTLGFTRVEWEEAYARWCGVSSCHHKAERGYLCCRLRLESGSVDCKGNKFIWRI